MADLDIDDDFREKFAYLFKPITDFAKGFEIDLIEVLRDYDSKTVEAETGFNFINAAAMLQGTTNVYGKRVDILHKAVSNFTNPVLEKDKRKQVAAHSNHSDDNVSDKELDEIRVDTADDSIREPIAANVKQSRLNNDNDDYRPPTNRTRTAEELNNDERQCGVSASDIQAITKVKLPEKLHRNIAKASIDDNCLITRDPEEGLCIFERFHTNGGGHFPMYVTMKREYSLMYTMPGNMMPLLQGEKRPVELFDLNGLKYGDVDDYRMCRDYVVHNFSIFSNLGGIFCYEFQEDHCAVFAEQLQQYLRSASSNQQPERCINDIERTLESDMKCGRPSQHLIELCRRISSGTSHRNSEDMDLKQVFTPLPTENDSCGFNNSFEQMDVDNVEPFVANPDVTEPTGRITRASRQSNRLTTQIAIAPQVEFNDDTFPEIDMYELDKFCNKPVQLVCRMKTASRKAVRLRLLRLQKNNDRKSNLAEEIADYFADEFKEMKIAMEKNVVESDISLTYQLSMLNEQQRRQAVQKEIKRSRLRGQRALRNFEEVVVSDMTDVPLPPPSAQNAVHVLERSLHDFNNQEVYSFNNVTVASFINEPVPMGEAMDTDMNASFHFAVLNTTAVQDKENIEPLTIIDATDDATDYVDIPEKGPEVPDSDDALLFADLPENSTIQNVVRVFLNRKWNMALKKQPEYAVKLAKWERKMLPILTNLTDDFVAHDYGNKIFNCFEDKIGNTLNFEKVANGTASERSRYLLSLLMLSNRNNVMLHSAHKDVIDERINVDDIDHIDFKVELLKNIDWHGNEMNQSGII